jgi:1,4-dihydroxy-2-naphthoyl-CoA hydrolase
MRSRTTSRGMVDGEIKIPEGFPSNWDKQMGFRILEMSGEKVVGEYVVDERHHQPYGIVHGGVHCSAVETVCSIGAGLSSRERGSAHGVVGLENHTSFIRAVRSGKVTVTATPVTRGRQSQLWEAESRDDQGRLVAQGKVRLLCLQADAVLGGRTLDGRQEDNGGT